MLTEKMQTALNEQINMELAAFYTYLSMSADFEEKGMPGFAAWMRHHAEEEMTHAMKIYDFVLRRRGRVTLKAVGAPKAAWDTALAAFEDAFAHERKVSVSIDNLVTLAREEGDRATDSFLQWFVDEQVEEEEVVSNAIDKLKMVGGDGAGLYMVDRELAADAATPEAEDE